MSALEFGGSADRGDGGVDQVGTAVSDDEADGTEETGGTLALADDDEEAEGDY